MSEDHDFGSEEKAAPSKKSKTRKKKEMLALQELGEQLAELKVDLLKRIPMPEELLVAVLETRRMKKHEARRRHFQYLGALMRQIDAEPIREALLQVQQGHGRDIRLFHRVEEWRDRLLSGDSQLLQELCERFAGLEPSEILRLVNLARKEAESGMSKGAQRALFRVLMSRLKASREEEGL